MINNKKLSNRIMRRVYVIWFSRKILPYLAAEILFFGFFTYLVAHNVYVSRVFLYAAEFFGANSHNPAAWTWFAFDIFMRTRLIVQLSVLGSLAMFALVSKTFIKSAVQFALTKDETRFAGRAF